MTRLTITLLAALGASLLVNLLTISRLSETTEPRASRAPAPRRDAEAVPAPAAAVEGEDRLDLVVRELQGLRRELENLRYLPGSPGEQRPAGARGPAASPDGAVPDEPTALAHGLVADQRQFDRFWGDLQTLNRTRNRVGEDTFQDALLASTAEYLELPPPQREAFLRETKAIAAEVSAEWKQVYDQAVRLYLNPRDAEYNRRESRALINRFNAHLLTQSQRLQRHLSDDQVRHQQFRQQHGDWVLQYLAPPDAIKFKEWK